MLTFRNRIAIAGLAASLLAASGAVKADSITQSFNIPTTTTPFTDTIGYGLFNSNLGTLTSVTYELVTAGTAEVDLVNFTGTSQTFTGATATLPFSISGPAGVGYSSSIVAGPISGSIGSGIGPYAFPGIPGGNDSGAISVLPSSLWPVNWEAPGGGSAPVDFSFATSFGTYKGSASPGVFFSGSGSIGGTLTIVYTYTDASTPEPGAWALLVACASVSIAGIRRRRAVK